MFGTLVVQILSNYSGAELIRQSEVLVDLASLAVEKHNLTCSKVRNHHGKVIFLFEQQ